MSGAAVVGDDLYRIVTRRGDNGAAYSIEARAISSSQQRWAWQGGERQPLQVAATERLVLFTSTGPKGAQLGALDRASGKELWSMPLPNVSAKSPLLLAGDRLFVVTGDSQLVRVVLGSTPTSSSIDLGFAAEWVAPDHDTLYAAGGSNVAAFDLVTDTARWRTDVAPFLIDIRRLAVIDGHVVLAGSAERPPAPQATPGIETPVNRAVTGKRSAVISLAVTDGKAQWRYGTDSYLAGMAVTDDRVIVTATGADVPYGGLIGPDLSTGKVSWTKQMMAFSAPLIATEGLVYTVADVNQPIDGTGYGIDPTLTAVDPQSGAIRWKRSIAATKDVRSSVLDLVPLQSGILVIKGSSVLMAEQ